MKPQSKVISWNHQQIISVVPFNDEKIQIRIYLLGLFKETCFCLSKKELEIFSNRILSNGYFNELGLK